MPRLGGRTSSGLEKFSTGVGWATLGAVVTLVAAGYFTIRKIVAIEV